MYIKTTNSTNTLLKELLAKGDRRVSKDELFYVRADFQTAGRGQTGNSWESEEGKNLLCSILLPPRKNPFELNMIVSVAVQRLLGDDFTIKWPNDIYWRDKKVAGILIENAIIGREVKYSIAGIGLNVNQTEWRSNAPNPVSLKQITGKEQDLDALMEQLLKEVKSALDEDVWEAYKRHLYRREGFWPFAEREVSTDPTMNVKGEELRVKSGELRDAFFMARIEDVLPTGEIILRDENNQQRKYHFKQIRYIV